MNYYVADTHLGHANILHLTNLPFDSIEDYDRTIIDNWNQRISPEDDVWIIGDFAYRTSPDRVVNYLQRLLGHKHLIVGNHDTKNIRQKSIAQCFDSIDEYRQIEDQGQRLFLSHYPTVEWPGYFRSAEHIFGHVHNAQHAHLVNWIRTEPRAHNAGVMINDYAPVTLAELRKNNDRFYRRIRSGTS